MKRQATIILSLFFVTACSTILSQPKNSVDDVSVTRNVSATRYSPDGEPMVVITLIINKNATRGHATLEEDFLANLNATVIKSDNAVFESKDGKVTFDWINIPMDKEVTVSYQLEMTTKSKEDQSVSGQFSYQNHIYTITLSSFSLKVVSGEKKPPPLQKKDPPQKKTNPVIVKPAPAQDGLVYRIQIAAVGDKSQADDILKKYKITDEPYLEEVNSSALRLMIGNYPNLSSAKARITDLKSKGLNEAFVVPYYNGKRITLQEAAMHTKQ